jgi:hypothetical protein
MERHADDGPDADLIREIRRDEVVELLVEPGDVGQDASDAWQRQLRRRRPPGSRRAGSRAPR